MVAAGNTPQGSLAREVLRDHTRPWSFKPATFMQYLESRAYTLEQLELGRVLVQEYQAHIEQIDRDLRHAAARELAIVRPKQAADLLGVSMGQLQRLRLWGHVEAKRDRGGWLYHKQQLEEFTKEEVQAKLRGGRAYTT
jgi:hypothetical protein